MSIGNFLAVLGRLLKETRLAAELTQEQVAAKAKVSREYISMIEADRYKPTVDVLLRICKAMDVKAWKVLKRIEEEKY